MWRENQAEEERRNTAEQEKGWKTGKDRKWHMTHEESSYKISINKLKVPNHDSIQ